MKSTGKTLFLLLLLSNMWASTAVFGAVSASIDRNRVALGDALRLTIMADDGEEISATDLQPLQEDFQILQRSTSSNMSIINGRSSHTKQLIIDMAPRREGSLMIPPLRVEKIMTNRLVVTVTAAPDVNTGGQSVIFEAEVDHDSVYVQAQVMLTLRIYQAINLEGQRISELELENAFVKPLEQNTFQRSIEGRQWLVHEVRYAIFPEQSGTLEIPAQVFSGRVREGRRSLFSRGGGRLLRRNSKPLSIEVKPRPDSFTGSTWLPAHKVTIEERWSTAPEQLRAGESATRTIRLQGEGVLGAQLPPMLFSPTDGLKFYPDQPDINEQEISSGLLGVRTDSAAIVPTRAGEWAIPEVRIPWWDTKAEQIRYAVLPARTLSVGAADPTTTPAAPPPVGAASASGGTVVVTEGTFMRWQLVSTISVAGWLLTLLYLWRTRRPKPVAKKPTTQNVSEKNALNHLLAACADGDAPAARLAVIDWTGALVGKTNLTALDQVAAQFKDEALKKALADMDANLYSPANNPWQGAILADCVRRLRAEYLRRGKSNTVPPLVLYPQA